MKPFVKWLMITGCAVILLVGAAVVILPRVVDVEQYKPLVEQKASEAIGRPFHLGGDLDLSVFPWLGVSFSDLHLGNLPGFNDKDLLYVKSFEARVKLMPLLSREIQVSRIALDGPELILERRKDGTVSWGGLGKGGETGKTNTEPPAAESPKGSGDRALPIKSLAADAIAVTHGRVLWRDQVAGVEKEIRDITLELNDVTLDKPIRLAFSAVVDGKPVSLDGTLGPLGTDPGKGTLTLDLTLKALKEVGIRLSGTVTDPASDLTFDMEVGITPFSPRRLMAALGQDFPVKTRDPAVLDRVSLDMNVKGDMGKVAVSGGRLKLDDSQVTFTAAAADFAKPDITVDVAVDTLDVDRYLPPKQAPAPAGTQPAAPPAGTAEKKPSIDYAPLRKLVLDAKLAIGKLKANNATIEDLLVRVTGKQGLFTLDPLSLNCYTGTVGATARLDVKADVPKTTVELQTRGVKAGPLIKDVMAREIIEGSMDVDAALSLTGDTPETIQKSLNGNGEVVFTDGAIIGLDLAGMVRNTASSFGLTHKDAEKPRTDFAELRVPFTLADGVFTLASADMKSPLLRVTASGKADLVKTTLDMKIDPKVVATLKGQGDTEERKGVRVPVLVTGTFAEPKFRPDLVGILQNDPKDLKNIIEDKNLRKETLKSLEQDAKSFFKGFEKKKSTE